MANYSTLDADGLMVYWGVTPQQQPGSYQGGEMMMMKSVFWWRKPESPEETTDIQQVTDETFHTYGNRDEIFVYIYYCTDTIDSNAKEDET